MEFHGFLGSFVHLHKLRISAGSTLVRKFHGFFESVGDPEAAETIRSAAQGCAVGWEQVCSRGAFLLSWALPHSWDGCAHAAGGLCGCS